MATAPPSTPGCGRGVGSPSAGSRRSPFPTPRGPMYPCLGVYTIDGRASGIFGRLASGPLIDFAATEAAVLVDVDVAS